MRTILIELRKLKIVRALSEETTCYTAEIWIDGRIAFHASNRGHGGADHYRRLGDVTEAEVDAWVKANQAARTVLGHELESSLENHVAVLIDEAEAITTLRRRLRTSIVIVENDQVFSVALRKRPPGPIVAALRAKSPAAEFVDPNDAVLLLKAARLMLDASETPNR